MQRSPSFGLLRRSIERGIYCSLDVVFDSSKIPLSCEYGRRRYCTGFA